LKKKFISNDDDTKQASAMELETCTQRTNSEKGCMLVFFERFMRSEGASDSLLESYRKWAESTQSLAEVVDL
jgi:hypothetical protein